MLLFLSYDFQRAARGSATLKAPAIQDLARLSVIPRIYILLRFLGEEVFDVCYINIIIIGNRSVITKK